VTYETLLVDVTDGVATVTLNRPEVRNALNHQTIAELVDALETFDRDDAIRCMVLTGDDRAFAAGADCTELERRAPSLALRERSDGRVNVSSRQSSPPGEKVGRTTTCVPGSAGV